MKPFKIIIVGAWRWPFYEEVFANALIENNIEVFQFSSSEFFKGRFGRIQAFLPFPWLRMLELNKKIVEISKTVSPHYVLFWRQTHIFPSTLKKISDLGIRTISYNNDDPFGPMMHGNVPWHHHFLWYWYLKCLSLFEFNFFYRSINCTEAKLFGAKHVDLLLPYFIPDRDHKVKLTQSERSLYETDVVFVGHYEPDGREKSIRALVVSGLKVKVWGGKYWSKSVLGNIYDELAPILPVEGKKYTKALCGAKICLCFLSKLNRDTYTRRCFEIPACGKVMLAERTEDLIKFFKEDKEACFFSSNEELVKKAKWLIENPKIRKKIAKAGFSRVWEDGHDVKSRALEFITALKN